jgi:hypothetical protein
MKSRRGLWFVAGSAILHLVVVLLLLQAMLAPRSFIALFTRDNEPMRPEHVTYVVPVTPPVTESRIPKPIETPRPRVVTPRNPAPSTTVVLPKMPTAPATIDSGVALPGTGATIAAVGVGAGLPTLNPSNPDPRIHTGVGPIPDAPERTGIEAMRFSVDSAWRAHKDSIARMPNPYNWTIGEGDKKFGLDQKWIYLGKIKIPTMLLGLLPLKGVQANPQIAENNRTLGAMASEVRERGFAARTRGEEIKAINARLERERNARLRAAAAASGDRKVPPQS